eukprot:scaffold111_cov252-Pinguiococcus_pyrenoidosus.AAC.9
MLSPFETGSFGPSSASFLDSPSVPAPFAPASASVFAPASLPGASPSSELLTGLSSASLEGDAAAVASNLGALAFCSSSGSMSSCSRLRFRAPGPSSPRAGTSLEPSIPAGTAWKRLQIAPGDRNTNSGAKSRCFSSTSFRLSVRRDRRGQTRGRNNF